MMASTSFSARETMTLRRAVRYSSTLAVSSIFPSALLSFDMWATDKPYPHVGRDLVVTAPAGMQLSSNVFANDLAQAAFVGSVDILVVRLDLELSSQLQTPDAAAEPASPRSHSPSTSFSPRAISLCSC